MIKATLVGSIPIGFLVLGITWFPNILIGVMFTGLMICACWVIGSVIVEIYEDRK